MSNAYLSKSKYMAGLQCVKRLWTEYHAKADVSKPDLGTQARFDQGHIIGELAKQCFPDGIDIEWDQSSKKVIKESLEKINERKPLFEAGFVNGRCYSRIDVLNPVGDDEWDLIEVKSSTSVKDQHYPDVAFQKHCCEGAGLKIRNCFLMHINNQYVRQGEIDPNQLLMQEDVSDDLSEHTEALAKNVPAFLAVIDQSESCPECDIGPHCDDPYGCCVKDKCWARLYEHDDNVFTLKGGGKQAWELYRKGIFRNADIPDDFNLNTTPKIQVSCEKTGNLHVNPDALREFLDTMEYPLYFLDFETMNPAIPAIDNSRPYQQIPFQYSLHILENEDSEPTHHSWLWDGGGDPRNIMLHNLRDLIGCTGSIVAYNASFEQGCIRQSAEAFGEYIDCADSLNSRFVDLYAPFRALTVYHPDQHGSASMKAVLPALTGKSYSDLEISEGGQASIEYMNIMFGDADAAELARVRNALEIYCAQDTMGMIDILRKLRNQG